MVRSLRNVIVVGELSLDEASNTVTIPGSETWVALSGTTVLGNETTPNVSSPNDGVLEYGSNIPVNVHITSAVSVDAASGKSFSVGIGKNGTIEPTSIHQGQTVGGGVPIPVAPSGIEDLQNGDTIQLLIRNDTDATNLTVESYNLNFIGTEGE